jgi:tetratricopeptide (TPR) repeat protein
MSLADADLAQDILEEAVPLYLRVLTIDPRHKIALYNLGLSYFDLQEYHLSIQWIQRFVDTYPNDSQRTNAERLIERSRRKLEEQER